MISPTYSLPIFLILKLSFALILSPTPKENNDMEAKSNAIFLFNFIKLKSLLNLQEILPKFEHYYWNEWDRVGKIQKGKLIKGFWLINTYKVVLIKSRNKETLDLIKTLKDL